MSHPPTGSAGSGSGLATAPASAGASGDPSGFDLSHTVSLVTGSTAGIGLGIARALGHAGSRVVITSRRADVVARCRDELGAEGIDVGGTAADVRDAEQVAALVAHVAGEFGRLDILVNNAGGSFGDTYRSGPLLDMSPEDLLESYRSNVVSAFLCARAALPHLRRSGRGAIVNVASMAPYGSVARGMGTYAAAKAGLIALTRTMAAEWAPHVRVNAVAPGSIDTPRTTSARSDAVLSRLDDDIVLGRLGTPADVGWCVCYLAAPASEWMTGSIMRIDGGESLS